MSNNIKDLKSEILEIASEVKKAAEAYYQQTEEVMTDAEYDTKFEYLEKQFELYRKGELSLDKETVKELNEVLNNITAGSEPEGTVVYHDYPMLSLAKAKNESELKAYHKRLVSGGAKGFTLQAKLDGLAMSAKYSNGKLVQLATRGDGVKGELLNHLIGHKEVNIVGLPLDVEKKEDFELRGELYISDAQFEEVKKARFEVTGEMFSNSRNAATGITKRSISGLGYKAEMSFSTYSVHEKGKLISFKELTGVECILPVDKLTLDELKKAKGSEVKVEVGVELADLEQAVKEFGELRDSIGIPTDGVVIKPTNEAEMLEKMGYTSRFPIAYIAYKYPGAKSVTVVEDIIVTVGKTGRLTPQAKVTPVEVDGVIISNITCHNYSWLNEMGIKVGSKVAVTRANDVIPAIDSVILAGDGDEIVAPEECPECGSKLKGDGTAYPKTLTCESLECPSKVFSYLKSIVGRNYLYLDSLGDVALKALVDSGMINSVVDLFRMDESELAEVVTGKTSTGGDRTIGSGNAKNIMKSIEKAKESTDSNKLLASLNMPGVGPNTAKRLIEHFGGIEEVLVVHPSKIAEVPQAGESLVETFNKYQAKALADFRELVSLGVKVNDPEEREEVEIKGSFSISGSVPEGFANRNEFVEYMEKNGWEYHKSPKKTTDYLFADPNGTSSKIKKAREHGTKIVNDLESLK